MVKVSELMSIKEVAEAKKITAKARNSAGQPRDVAVQHIEKISDN